MKKFFALVLALVLAMSIGYVGGYINSAEKAEAVTIGTPNYGTHDTVVSEDSTPIETEVRFILSKGGQPVGVLTEHEATYRKNLGIVSYGGGSVTSAMANGKVVRAKNIATVTLKDDMLFEGSSVVYGTIEYLSDSVKTIPAATLIDDTAVVHKNVDGTYTAYHRFIQSDSAGEKVAVFHMPGTGKKVSIWLTDWDGDGVRNEYALRAGTASNSNPDPVGTGYGNNGSTGGNVGSTVPNPQHPAVVLPPSSSGNSGGNSSGSNSGSSTPNPQHPAVTLPGR